MAALTSAFAALSVRCASSPPLLDGSREKSKGASSSGLGFLSSSSLGRQNVSTPVFSRRAAQSLKRLEKLGRPATVTVDAKYKLKTHKATAKRYKVTGAGRITRRHAGRQHLLTKKSTKRKNRLGGRVVVARGSIDNIVGAAPYMKVKRRLKDKVWGEDKESSWLVSEDEE